MYRLFFLLLLSNVFCMDEETAKMARMLHNTCTEETGVAEVLIEDARKGNFAEDETLKCYIKCVMEQMACIDDNGIVDVEATIAVLPEETKDAGAAIIRKCGTKVGKNACDNAWLTNKCYYDENPSYDEIRSY